MRLAIISFTKAGSLLAEKLQREYEDRGMDCEIRRKEETLNAWTRRQFETADGLIYIGAAGIAVRSIAPYLKDKYTDPAVVVVDEAGRYAISLLSGHVGGANRLAVMTAHMLGAEPVITTASDVQGIPAVDVWAKEHELQLSDRKLAIKTAAALANGEMLGFYSDYPCREPLFDPVNRRMCQYNLWITSRIIPPEGSILRAFVAEEAAVLRLIPRTLAIGVGCRKGASCEQIEQAVRGVLLENNLDIRAAACLASIDQKEKEAGLRQLAESLQLPFVTYTAMELETASESRAESAFVKTVTGVGNVCEKAALLAAGSPENRRLIVEKTIRDGVTVAVAESLREI